MTWITFVNMALAIINFYVKDMAGIDGNLTLVPNREYKFFINFETDEKGFLYDINGHGIEIIEGEK